MAETLPVQEQQQVGRVEDMLLRRAVLRSAKIVSDGRFVTKQAALEQPPLPVQEPVAWDVFELRLYGAPQEKQHRVLWVERYIQPDGLTPDLDGLLEAAKTDGGIDGGAKTLHVRPLYTTPQQQQAEPVAWDKPSDNFNEWWDSDRHDNANPFEKDSYAYWAWEGWQAALAQRPWVGLTDEEIKTTWSQLYCDVNHMKFAPEDRPQKETVGFLFARAIEAKLKERNI